LVKFKKEVSMGKCHNNLIAECSKFINIECGLLPSLTSHLEKLQIKTQFMAISLRESRRSGNLVRLS
jgi:hypothetical protein